MASKLDQQVCRRIDYGSIYASTTFLARDRRLWIGWSYETALGCEGTCSSGTPFTQMLVSFHVQNSQGGRNSCADRGCPELA